MVKPLVALRITSRCLLAALGCTSLVCAETLPDPTQPPSMVSPAQNARGGAGSDSGPTLQSVLVSPQRTIAVINGQTVKTGDRFGEARVVKITESEVVLRNGKDLQVLKLFPDIEKQRTPSRATAKADAKQQ